ncbi:MULTISPECIES: ABC transporter permease [Pseudomonas]|jgi:octopine/nopaline transport system permease protein|uniref:ABC transporter permease n=1 Tax=Pseudomonas TaxID=286 RepID=UPI000272CF3F|nr:MULTISPECIES: ABC transporter permease subunit [Pseudomonas]MDP9064029.1 ABC transporter permease subunit [Pseudomonadota bacterium]HEC54440.1 ABC transporter permease subunit [Gammaproteobacteria bacterium]AUO24443.1 ABC transporter permease [Pseudomonas sp. NC02]EJF73095.1 amino acid ABC transporter inner membrane protein [Pseudomonas sp. Ag1]MBT1270633.1 ABC transporter permease subunit [Pseudomonas sp. VS38]|eukprot:gene3546-4409_t
MSLMQMLSFGDTGWGMALLKAALMTVLLTLAALVVGALVGSLVAMAKLSKKRALRYLGDAYSILFRGIPELLVIYLFYFGGASVVTAVNHWFGGEGYVDVPPFMVGAIAVGLISASYQAEVYRGAFIAVAKGELEAALAIGMNRATRIRRVLIPQIWRYALPGLGNVWQMSLKDSALISVIGLVELMRASQVAAGSTRQYFTFYIVGGVCYLILTGLSGRLFNIAEARVQRTQRRNPAQS